MAGKLSAIIAVAGPAERFGGLDQLKSKVGGKSVICHSLDLFEADDDCHEIILVVSKESRAWIEGDPLTFASGKMKLVDGGTSRAESIAAGVSAASGELIALHDGNRPNFRADLVERLKQVVLPERGVVPAVEMHNALAYVTRIGAGEGDAAVTDFFGGKKQDPRIGHLMEHIDSEDVFVLQTPQLYYRASFQDAIAQAGDKLADYSDDSALYLAAGYEVSVIDGWLGNIKVVTPKEFNLLIKLMGGGTKKSKDKYGGLGW
ncbi:2-C-methyl-D-erythritol 4-phosphate cytidylyltransferase [bacterium]|nr:2-C-methyl-D-erythritol 4-phosphate cytidylyltransferase [bacterium]